jgi:hypothetical protein
MVAAVPNCGGHHPLASFSLRPAPCPLVSDWLDRPEATDCGLVRSQTGPLTPYSVHLVGLQGAAAAPLV